MIKNNNNIKKQKGSLLIGAILGLLVIGSVITYGYSYFKEKSIIDKGKLAGEQIRLLGQAVDEYISINRDKIANLQSDGNIKCQQNGFCELTIEGLKQSGELHKSFSKYNAYKSEYKIQIKREGTPPDYKITGIIIATDAPLTNPAKILGYALQTGGANSGNNITDLNKISGNSGLWSYTNKDFSIIANTKYQLAYRIGYNASQYSPYLRRDGSLPMTGALNMDQHNIRNVDYMDAKNVQINKDLNINGNAMIGGKLTGDIIPKQIVVDGQNCSPNGLIARDETGLTLSCVNGIWSTNSGSSELYMMNIQSDNNSNNFFKFNHDYDKDINPNTKIPTTFITGYNLSKKCFYSQLPSKKCACGFGKVGIVIGVGDNNYTISCQVLNKEIYNKYYNKCETILKDHRNTRGYSSKLIDSRRNKCKEIINNLTNHSDSIIGEFYHKNPPKEEPNRAEGGGFSDNRGNGKS